MTDRRLSASERVLVEENLALVEHIVNRLLPALPPKLDRDELVQAGVLGLLESVQRFEPERGLAFATYAGRRIEGSIRDAVRKTDWMPRAARTRARELAQLEDALMAPNGDRPTLERLAAEAGLTSEEITRVRAAVRTADVRSIDRPLGAGVEGSTLSDLLDDPDERSAPEELERRELLSLLRDGIRLLPERHRIVVVGYFLEEKAMDELATLLGVTQSRISQLKDDALRLLRFGLETQFGDAELSTATRAERRRAEYSHAITASRRPLSRLDDELLDLTDADRVIDLRSADPSTGRFAAGR